MAHEPARKRRKVQKDATALPGFTQYDLEADYARKSRKTADNKRQRLPLKTAEGQIVAQEVNDDAEVDEYDEKDVETGSVIDDVQESVEPAKPKLSLKEEILQAKEDLARVAGMLSENPEDHIDLLGRLKDLSHSENNTVQKLALATQLTVFKDIIPGYRIRPLAKDDLQSKVSKEVKKLRAFEQGLLAGYSDYIKTLTRLSKGVASSDAHTASIGAVAITCICNLITNVPHFNFRPDLISALVSILSHSRSSTVSIVQQIIDTFESTFRDDEDGHISLDAVGQITKMMKTKDYQIDERILNTFLHLRLLNEFRGKGSTEKVEQATDDAMPEKIKKQKREYRSKRERKAIRERKVIEKEMEQADAAVSHEERDQNQAESLKMVFIAYFRILKARIAHLTGAVLEGLARYAHLINQDFFGDVLEVLRDLIIEAETVQQEIDDDNDDDDSSHQTKKAVRQTLLCITTAFAMLQGQTDVAKSATQLHLDLNFFVTHLYRILPSLALDADVELSAKATHLQDPNGLQTPSIDVKVNVATTTVLLLRSLLGTLLPPTNTRAVPPARVAAFTKQLLSASLHVPAKTAVALLGVNNQLAKTHGNKIAALWNTEERRGDGVFNPLSEEIEAANPFATTAWEGELLRLHFDPKVQEGVKNLNRQIRETTK
ncbi:hypothetical protein AMS68_005463 [Peltaster fructicola]|uniref:Nucleolar complex-associated protein 3 n=1 Tax=Peltaster fructicola TaxID=286661 RepID=A0A6H0XZ34_9PEZI|nr:hypothetical protein AMS68_005463 [Peltaster fructicola]